MSNALLRRRRLLIAQAAGGGGGGGNTVYRGGAVLTYASGNFTCTAPAGIVAGDVIYACFLQDAGTTTGPTGFALDGTGTANTPTNGFPCTLLKKIAAGTESGTTLTFPSGASLGQGVLVVIGGANATQPDAATPNPATGTAASIAYPSITTATANAMHVLFACNFNALAGTPAGYTARQASTAWVSSFTKVIASAGPVSGITSSSGGEWVAFSAAVRSS